MDKLVLRAESLLGNYDIQGSGSFDDSRVEELERLVLDCQKSLGDSDTGHVSDSVYDALWDLLTEVKPDSSVLEEVWVEEVDTLTEYTSLLDKNPMMSIETAKSYSCVALDSFIDRVPDCCSYLASYKVNGHGIRWVYLNGELVSATSRARASQGRDITRQMKVILGERNEDLAEYGLVELRGEVALRVDKLDEAREFNPDIKSAFSAVASLLRGSSSDEELNLLDVLTYGLIIDGFSFSTKEEEYQEIERVGFTTPQYILLEECEKDDLLDTVVSVIKTFEDNYSEFGFFCDGVVLEVNDRDLFYSLGTFGNHNNGNIALKVGVWEQTQYAGVVNKIDWTRGKTKLSPVAIVADQADMLEEDGQGKILNYEELGVLTAQGNKVRRVPLYEPKNILVLEAYLGNVVYFKYGGEAGVVPCFPDGRLLKEDAAKETFESLDDGWVTDID